MPGGKAAADAACVAQVSNASKLQYLEALAQWRLAARVRREVAAFLRGLALLVPTNLLAIFDENELEVGRGEGGRGRARARARQVR